MVTYLINRFSLRTLEELDAREKRTSHSGVVDARVVGCTVFCMRTHAKSNEQSLY